MSLKAKLIQCCKKAIENKLTLRFKPDQDLDIHKFHDVYNMKLGAYNIQAEIAYGRTLRIGIVSGSGKIKTEIDRDDIPYGWDDYLIKIMFAD